MVNSIDPYLPKLHAALPDLRERYGVRGLWVFGSRRRGEARPDSDLDVLVELDDRPKKSLKPAIGRRILREAMPV